MRIDLGRLHAAVPEEILKGADIDTRLQHMGSKECRSTCGVTRLDSAARVAACLIAA